MSIQVTQDYKEKQFPIKIISGGRVQKFTIKAAIELRRKLETAICDYQIQEALQQ